MASQYARLTQVQRDCIEARGDCSRCLNTLESQECQVKYTRGCAPKLGLTIRIPARAVNDHMDPTPRASWMCGDEFEAVFNNARFCGPCLATKPRRTAVLRVCSACDGKFFGRYDSRRCTGCREASSIQRERRVRQPAKSA